MRCDAHAIYPPGYVRRCGREAPAAGGRCRGNRDVDGRARLSRLRARGGLGRRHTLGSADPHTTAESVGLVDHGHRRGVPAGLVPTRRRIWRTFATTGRPAGPSIDGCGRGRIWLEGRPAHRLPGAGGLLGLAAQYFTYGRKGMRAQNLLKHRGFSPAFPASASAGVAGPPGASARPARRRSRGSSLRARRLYCGLLRAAGVWCAVATPCAFRGLRAGPALAVIRDAWAIRVSRAGSAARSAGRRTARGTAAADSATRRGRRGSKPSRVSARPAKTWTAKARRPGQASAEDGHAPGRGAAKAQVELCCQPRKKRTPTRPASGRTRPMSRGCGGECRFLVLVRRGRCRRSRGSFSEPVEKDAGAEEAGEAPGSLDVRTGGRRRTSVRAG